MLDLGALGTALLAGVAGTMAGGGLAALALALRAGRAA
jgi:hypothetical protein